VAKARLTEVDGSTSLELRFNPKELSIQKSAEWTRQPNKGAPHASKPEFAGAKPRTLQMELLFDDWDDDSSGPRLVKQIEQLMAWMTPTKKSLRDTLPQPAILQLQWGSSEAVSQFQGFIKSCTAKYTLFKSDGTPIRATANLSMEEIPHDAARTNPTSGAVTSRRTHVVAAGDSLHSIAYTEYRDAGFWRALAVFNGIDDPLRIRPGRELGIPSLSEAAELH
jgi:nucleoid-associated protein YgaU